MTLDDWQADCVEGAGWVQPDGRWSAFEAAVIVARQNGKGSILEARQLGGLFVYGERLQIHTAHEFKTTYEHFRRLVGLVESSPLLTRQLKPRTGIRTGAGDQAIELKNGNRIRFLARSRTSGRGFSADTIYLDEAFELNDETMGALLPTLSARPNPQIWYTSSAPHDTSTVLHRLRRRGRSADEPRLFFAEWCNDPGVDPADPAAWARANPALGIRIQPDDIAAQQRSMSAEEFEREILGVAEDAAGGSGVIPMESFLLLVSPTVEATGKPTLAADASPSREFAAISVCDDKGNVEVIDHREDVTWVADRVTELAARELAPVAIDTTGPLAGLCALLPHRGVNVIPFKSSDISAACPALVDAIVAGSLSIRSHPALEHAVASARRSDSGDRWRFTRSRSSGDISPLMSVVLAHWGAATRPAADFFAY